jgi:hypothetical protein
LVFWLLIALALVVFAPCMILPAWREYQAAEISLRQRARDAKLLEQHADRLERRLDAIHNDPVVIARLARRELGCTLPGEVRLAVSRPADAPPRRTEFRRTDDPPLQPIASETLTPVKPPVGIARLTAYLPNLNYDALFCASPARETLLGMSVALIAAAFVIFWPRCPRT